MVASVCKVPECGSNFTVAFLTVVTCSLLTSVASSLDFSPPNAAAYVLNNIQHTNNCSLQGLHITICMMFRFQVEWSLKSSTALIKETFSLLDLCVHSYCTHACGKTHMSLWKKENLSMSKSSSFYSRFTLPFRFQEPVVIS